MSLMRCAWLAAHQRPRCVMNRIKRVQDILWLRTSRDIQSEGVYVTMLSQIISPGGFLLVRGSYLRNCGSFRLGLLPCRGKPDGSSHSGGCPFGAASSPSAEEALCKANPLVITLVALGCTDWALLPNRAPAQSGTIPSAKPAAEGSHGDAMSELK